MGMGLAGLQVADREEGPDVGSGAGEGTMEPVRGL